MYRLVRISTVVAAALSLVMVGPGAQAAPARHFTMTRPFGAGGQDCGYHYAGMITTTTNVGAEHWTTQCSGPQTTSNFTPYYGWAGIEGQIQTPPTNTAIGALDADHQAGWIGINFANGGWIQIGWFRGTVGCDASHQVSYSGTGYHMDIEVVNDANAAATCVGYSIVNQSPLSLGGTVSYRIEYTSGCWDVFYGAAHPVHRCDLQPISGFAEMENELYGGDDTVMPSSDFGVASSSSASALRLKGAGGWVPWTTTISHGTEEHDWRGRTDNEKTVVSAYSTWWHMKTYGA